MALSIPSVLTPIATAEKTIDVRTCQIRCQRVIDRALIESTIRMREVLQQDDPLSSPDLQELVNAESKLQSLAQGLEIAEEEVTAEVKRLSPEYVKEKDAVRAENTDPAKEKMVKKLTRFITNKYATCEALANLILEELATRKRPTQNGKPAAKTPNLKPAIVKPPVQKEQELPLPDDGDFTLQINEEPLDLGPDTDLSKWLDEPRENDSVIGTSQPPAEEAKPKK